MEQGLHTQAPAVEQGLHPGRKGPRLHPQWFTAMSPPASMLAAVPLTNLGELRWPWLNWEPGF